MAIAHSTYYHERTQRLDEAGLLTAIIAICDEFEAYGRRRVWADLQHQGIFANHKRIKRLMREHELQPRYVATTDSAHDLPVVPDLAKGITLTHADQLWVADLTYVAIGSGFAYVAIIMDACRGGWLVMLSAGRSTLVSPLPRLKRRLRSDSRRWVSYIIPTAPPGTQPLATVRC